MRIVSQINDSDPIPLSDVRSSVKETIARLGFQPDLLLIHNPFVAEPGKLVELYVLFYFSSSSPPSMFRISPHLNELKLMILVWLAVYSWQILEDMKDKGELLSSLGVSNFRPQDLEAVLKVAKYKPVVNRMSFLISRALDFVLLVLVSVAIPLLPARPPSLLSDSIKSFFARKFCPGFH